MLDAINAPALGIHKGAHRPNRPIDVKPELLTATQSRQINQGIDAALHCGAGHSNQSEWFAASRAQLLNRPGDHLRLETTISVGLQTLQSIRGKPHDCCGLVQ